ncbi:MAG: ribosome maturation factor RimM [Gammaproteobacteria bacterium]
MAGQRHITAGKISGAFGIKGWIKVFSYTEPKDNILVYSPWLVRTDDNTVREFKVMQGKTQGKAIVAHLQGIDDRDAATELLGADIEILYSQLPQADQGSYYWADLVGLKVVTTEGDALGEVDHLMETGANDVLVVTGERERLIPFLQPQTVTRVDLEAGLLVVDWDPEF